MAKTTEEDLIKSLAAIMTVAEELIGQLGVIAKLYGEMPDDIKRKIAAYQVEKRLKNNG